MKYITFGETTANRIKQARNMLGLTQAQFGQLMGVSKPTIERWERSKEGITGPIAMLVEMLIANPEYMERMKIPERRTPLRLWYMYENRPCTVIDVDEMKQKVYIHNYVDHLLFRAFGVNEHPSYADYVEFLKSRCFPETRDKMKLILQDMNLPFYDPFLIVEKTQGRMAEDDFWIKVERME